MAEALHESLLDLDRLNPYLRREVPVLGRVLEAEKFGDGQSNPTFLLTGESGRCVLRRQPAGELLKSAHAVDREFRVMDALQHSDVPVPRTLHLCMDRSVIGSLFFLMSYEPGRIFWDPTLPDLQAQRRADVYAEMNRVLAALHDVDIGRGRAGRFRQAGGLLRTPGQPLEPAVPRVGNANASRRWTR